MCPNLEELILVVGLRKPGPKSTLQDLKFITYKSLDKYKDQEWVDKIDQGYIRNWQSGNITTNFRFSYARLKRNRA